MHQNIVIFIYGGVRNANLTNKKISLIMASDCITFRKFDYTLDKLELMEKVI